MPNPQLCQRIVCGAVSQAEAGLDALWECSEAGHVGVLPCTHPDCRPYMDELRAKGICSGGEYDDSAPAVTEVLPLHPTTQPDDGEQPGPPVPVNLPAGEMTPWRTPYCRVMEWVAGNPSMAAACIVAGWYFLAREKR